MYEYTATVTRVVDGDTVWLNIDLGMDTYTNKSIRIYGIDAPEMSTDAGKRSKAAVENLLPIGTLVLLHTIKDRREKYGRYLGEITVGDDLDLGSWMVEKGLAKPYDGGAR